MKARLVMRRGHVFLWDHLLSPTLFQWQSQNRTRRDAPTAVSSAATKPTASRCTCSCVR